jgi:hypothetical protein
MPDIPMIREVKAGPLYIDTVTEVDPSIGVCAALEAMPHTLVGWIVINDLIVFIIEWHIGPNRYFIGRNQYCPTARSSL